MLGQRSSVRASEFVRPTPRPPAPRCSRRAWSAGETPRRHRWVRPPRRQRAAARHSTLPSSGRGSREVRSAVRQRARRALERSRRRACGTFPSWSVGRLEARRAAHPRAARRAARGRRNRSGHAARTDEHDEDARDAATGSLQRAAMGMGLSRTAPPPMHRPARARAGDASRARSDERRRYAPRIEAGGRESSSDVEKGSRSLPCVAAPDAAGENAGARCAHSSKFACTPAHSSERIVDVVTRPRRISARTRSSERARTHASRKSG